VADTFDALTSDRPYRDALAVASAVSILEQGAGKQWDRRVVDALVTTLRETPGVVPVGSTGGGNETAASVAASVATPPATPTASPISASAGRGPDDTR
jgi:HD-GYP domain-containing protein (c-di-GMP phosphodiesterase class II)